MLLEKKIVGADNTYFAQQKIEQLEKDGWKFTGEITASNQQIVMVFVRFPKEP